MRRRGRRAGVEPSGTLADLAPGQSAEVVSVSAAQAPRTARRLAELGFAPGSRVEVVRQAPLGTPVLYRVQGYEISLRRTEAARIVVTRRTAPAGAR
ncbi:FeoA family protein [Nocardioides ferulae]|uniref:FeoA family protein n=1 Tax=Nocardioides ferulae TaxID=2340821 RepID=UPI000EABDAA7|nr:FeoA family protein [Nocardioides ferulae]